MGACLEFGTYLLEVRMKNLLAMIPKMSSLLIDPLLNRHLIKPTLPLPLKGREIAPILPLQGGGREGDGDLPE
jgi:hypothetical protein